MKIEILATGSTGNSFLYGGTVLVDAGAPYKKIKSHISDIAAVLLSHQHF